MRLEHLLSGEMDSEDSLVIQSKKKVIDKKQEVATQPTTKKWNNKDY